MPKIFKEDPDKIKLSLVETNREDMGAYGNARVSFIKDQFNNIIDNLLPNEMKFALLLGDYMPVSY